MQPASSKEGGTVRFATRSDARSWAASEYSVLRFVTACATTAGLLDFDENMNLKPGLAEFYDISKDLKTYTFKLRKGAEYHNGQTIDADSIKWNIERIKDPKIGHAFTRSAITDVERVTVDDKYGSDSFEEPKRDLRGERHVLSDQHDGTGWRGYGRHQPARLRSVQVQELEAF